MKSGRQRHPFISQLCTLIWSPVALHSLLCPGPFQWSLLIPLQKNPTSAAMSVRFNFQKGQGAGATGQAAANVTNGVGEVDSVPTGMKCPSGLSVRSTE